MKLSLRSNARIVVAMIATSLFFISNALPAQAQSPKIEFTGYAWSNNIGWISLNCTSGGNDGTDPGTAADDICGTGSGKSNYKVVIDSNKKITGYAWSSNIGWIRFGGLEEAGAVFPNNSGNVKSDAMVTGTYPDYTFQGWARACAGTASNTNLCDNMANNPNSGGWDGWISLMGANHQLRMVDGDLVKWSTTNSKDGFAWGSTVVGWIDMFTRADILVAPDITIESFAHTGTPKKGNKVNDVAFTAKVAGVPVQPAGTPENKLPKYKLSIGSIVQEGRYRQENSTSGTFDPKLELDGLSYGFGIVATLEIDLPRPGLIKEDDGDDSNGDEETSGNTQDSAPFDLKVDPPIISLVSKQTKKEKVTIRQNEIAELGWSISAPYSVSCTAKGNVAGAPQVGHDGGVGVTEGSFKTNKLTNRSQIDIVCTGIFGAETKSVTIDMIPTIQEI